MKRINRDQVIYSFTQKNQPVARVEAGESFTLKTWDCFKGQLKSNNDEISAMDWNKINPATGPIYIAGAQTGDILKITIESIKLNSPAVMIAAPEEGVLGHLIEKSVTKILPLESGQVVFSDHHRFDLKPMVGVLGVAPEAGEDISTGIPGIHGGNMDCALLGPGAVLYLPVNIEGALLAAGDMHALMGDGEIVVCAAEAGGEIQLKAEIIKEVKYPLPLIETEEFLATVSSKKTVDEAIESATEMMANFLTDNYNYTLTEAGMLMSLVGNAEICQVVDPLKTARFTIKKSDFNLKQNARS
ncbi:MAG: acetamidase/formamidase family protein [Bacillota bacterium]